MDARDSDDARAGLEDVDEEIAHVVNERKVHVLTRIRELLALPVFEEEEQTRLASLLNVVALAALVVNVAGGLSSICVAGVSVTMLQLTGAGLLPSLIVLFLIRGRWIRLAGLFFCLGFWVVVTLFSLASGGLASPSLSFYGLLILTAGLLLGGRAGVGFAGLGIVSLAAIFSLEGYAVLPSLPIALTPVSRLVTQISVLTATAAVLYLAVRSVGDALERAHQNERTQIVANRELTALRASLEERVAELERAEKSLRDSEASYQALVENLPQSIFVKDLEGRFVFANQHFCDDFGKPLKEIVGKTDFDFHPPELAENYRADDRRIMERREILDIVEEHQVLGGEKSYVHVVKTPTYDSSGRVTGIQGIFWDVTERKRAEEILRQSHSELEKLVEARTAELANERNLLRTLIDTLPDVIYVKDTQSRIILANTAQARLLGAASADDLVGKADSDFFPKELATKYYEDEQTLFQSGQPLIGIEEPTVDPAGNRKWLITTKVPLQDRDGKIVGLVGMGRDITPLKHSEEALAKERNLLRTLIDNFPDAIFVKDTEGRFVVSNPAHAALFGTKTPEEVVGKTVAEILPSEQAPSFVEDDQPVLQAGQSLVNYEKPKPFSPSGQIEWNLTTRVPLRDGAGNIIGLVGIARDITERKRTEQALRESEERFRGLFEASPDAVVLLDPRDMRSPIVDCNQAACQMNGYAREELIGQSIDILNTSVTDTAQRLVYLERLRQEGVLRYEDYHRRKDGTVFPIEVSTTLIDLPGRELVLGIDRDITERKQAEETLRLQATRLQIAAEVARVVTSVLDIEQVLPRVADLIRERFGYYHVGVFLTEPDGEWTTLRASSSAPITHALEKGVKLRVGVEGMIGSVARTGLLRAAQDVSTDSLYLPHPLLPDTHAEAVIPLKEGDNVIGVLDVQSKVVNSFPTDAILILTTIADQISVAIQNSRLHSAEKQRGRELEQAYRALQENQAKLLAADKMASLGRLTAGVAHEMNTPLAAVRAALVELEKLMSEYRSSLEDPEVTLEDHREIAKEMQHSIQLAHDASKRAASFVRSIKSQTRDMSSAELQRFDAVPIVDEALLLLHHALHKAGCNVAFEHTAETMELFGLPGRLAQVVTNLVTNAMDASVASGGGPITLRLAPDSDGLELQVSDHGSGIAPEVLPRIFEPMFTTKPFGEGTGLGLSIVHDIVVGEFGGTIQVTTQVGQGSVFSIHFPKHKELQNAA